MGPKGECIPSGKAGARLILWALGTIALGASCSKPPQKPNLLLISIDTCRADRLSCYGFELPTSPNIDGLAEHGVLFEEAQSPVPITLPAHASMLTGDLPPTHGVRDNGDYRLGEEQSTAAERLRAEGYRTGAFVGAYVMNSSFGLDQGFEVYDEEFGSTAPGSSHSRTDRRAEEVTERALEWLGETDARPFFGFVHFYDPHVPYAAPEPFRTDFAEDAYAAEIAYTDAQVGRLVNALGERGLLENTWVIVTSDHGDGLGEHGEATHSFFTYQSTLRVPLVVRPPKLSVAMRIREPVSIADLTPTLLDAAGLAVPDELAGQSLIPLISGERWTSRPLYAESLTPTKFGCSPLLVLRQGSDKLILTRRSELYDLSSDPKELNNLAALQPERTRELRAGLTALLAERSQLSQSQRDSSATDQDRLQELGYVSDAEVDEALSFDSGEDPKDFIELFETTTEIYRYLRTKRYDLARQLCESILARRPELVEMQYYLGEIALGEGRWSLAAEHYANFLSAQDSSSRNANFRLGRGRANCHANYGLVLAELGRMGEAIAQYQAALALRPDNASVLNNLGFALLLTDHLPAAIRRLERSRELEPNTPSVHLNLGHAYTRRLATDAQPGDMRAATGAYARALELAPELHAAAIALARLRLAQEREPEAIEQLETARQNAPSAAIDLELAWLLATSSIEQVFNPTRAKELLEALPKDETIAPHQIQDTWAATHAALGNFEAAQEHATQAIELSKASPSTSEAIKARLQLYKSEQPFRR